MANAELVIEAVSGKADRVEFVDCAYRLNVGDPNWVPQLHTQELAKFTPGKNPYFRHARCQLFVARRDGATVGRIAAHIDELALGQPVEQGMGPGTGFWGAIEAVDEAVARALIAVAEDWLRAQGMNRAMAPMNLSVWEEPGLLVKGHDHPPMVMMAHHNAAYQGWIEAADYGRVKTLHTYDLDVAKGFPPLIRRIIASGDNNPKIQVREVDLKHFEAEAAIICDILNDAWSDNWGFVPFTDEEIQHIGKALKPLVHSDLIRIAAFEGEDVAFMMTLPDMNQVQARVVGPKGKPSPLGWAKLAWWLRRPKPADMRVPLMGVRKKLQSSRLAGQLAFMLIEKIRLTAMARYGTRRSEIGWVLEDNQGMVAIAKAIESTVNREYAIYARKL